MRLTWATDVHLEFPSGPSREAFAKSIADQKPDLVLLTGDIANAADIEWILHELQDGVGAKILFVLGNHDFYGGSIDEVREWAEGPWLNLEYMHGKLHKLNDFACIVGVDGMADGKLGSPATSNVVLNDWNLIDEMVNAGCLRDRRKRLKYLAKLGKEEASTLRPVLRKALSSFEQVFVMTHVPPWKEATWHEGSHSDHNWLPWFSCKAVGDCIVEESAKHPGKKITVLCGHTHGYGFSQITDDIVAHTGMATYYMPEIQLNFDVFVDGSYDKAQPTNSWEAEND